MSKSNPNPQLELFPNLVKEQTEQDKLILFQIGEIEENMSENDFQRDFFESLTTQYYARGYLTIPQCVSLTKMYERVTR